VRRKQTFVALIAVALLCASAFIFIPRPRDTPGRSGAAAEAQENFNPTTSAPASSSPAARSRPAVIATAGSEPADTAFTAHVQPTADVQSNSSRTHNAADGRANSTANTATASAATSTAANSAPSSDEAPAEWGITGSNAESYTLRTNRFVALSGSAASSDADTARFGALVQISSARGLAGKRVELSGYIASVDALAGAAIWLRADASDRKIVGFENTLPRGISGTHEWSYQSIVMDIPPEAAVLLYGAFLNGRGTLYVDDLQFRIVDESTPVTAKPVPSQGRSSAGVDLRTWDPPRNLDFEQTRPIEPAR
jgi:hypothetical protein